jgi:hypothetical protein
VLRSASALFITDERAYLSSGIEYAAAIELHDWIGERENAYRLSALPLDESSHASHAHPSEADDRMTSWVSEHGAVQRVWQGVQDVMCV